MIFYHFVKNYKTSILFFFNILGLNLLLTSQAILDILCLLKLVDIFDIFDILFI